MLSETCSPPLLFELRFSVISSGLEPALPLPRLITISEPALEVGAAVRMGVATGVDVPLVELLMLLLLRLIIISGPTLEGAAVRIGVPTGWVWPFAKVDLRLANACWAPAKSPDCRAVPMAVKSDSRCGCEKR